MVAPQLQGRECGEAAACAAMSGTQQGWDPAGLGLAHTQDECREEYVGIILPFVVYLESGAAGYLSARHRGRRGHAYPCAFQAQ